jgi:DNA-binding transcriptional ArsR family regulator
VVRVVDMASGRSPRRLVIAVQAMPAVEAMLALAVAVDDDASKYDVGEEGAQRVRALIPDDITDDIQALRAVDDKILVMIAGLGMTLGPDHDPSALLRLVEEDPARPWHRFVDHLGRPLCDWDDAPDGIDAALAALADRDLEALTQVQATLAQAGEEGVAPAGLGRLLALDPTEFGAMVARVLRSWLPAATPILAEGRPAIEREVAARSAEVDGADPKEFILRATNGYELPDEHRFRRVLLVPSYWFRPWIFIDEDDSSLLLSYPVSDQHLPLPSEAPPPAMVKLFKALGDEGRLRLLRMMANGPIALADAANELDVSKATAHHHLSTLRTAGLVSIQDVGPNTRYALRAEIPAVARDALDGYLTAGVPS